MRFIVHDLSQGQKMTEFEADRVKRVDSFLLKFYRRTENKIFSRWICIGVVETPHWYACTPAQDDKEALRSLGVKV
jgi:hypothetical protein